MRTRAVGRYEGDGVRRIYKASSPWLLAAAVLAGCGGSPEVELDLGDTTTTSESGGSVEVSISLARKPRGVVKVYAVSSDASEGRTSDPIQFDPTDWETPRKLTITGVDDGNDDGDIRYEVSFYMQSSWRHEPPWLIGNVTLTNLDDEEGEIAHFDALGDLPGGQRASYVGDVSAAGNVVVGWSSDEQGERAVRWTPELGLVSLGGPASRAVAVSPNGRIVAGSIAEPSYLQGRAGVRWVDDQAYEILEGPRVQPGGPILFMVAEGEVVRDDGRVYGNCLQYGAYGEPLACLFAALGSVDTFGVGHVYAADAAGNFAGTRHAERHAPFSSVATYNGTTLPYPDAIPCNPGTSGCEAEARDFSSGGVLIVGTSNVPAAGSADPTRFRTAFTFSQDQGALSLPDLPDGERASGAYAVSANGRVIAGFASDAQGRQAVVWLERAPTLLADLLQAAGGQLPTGFRLLEVRALSTDGRTFVGNGTNGDGAPEAFRIVLPVAP
jgi:uncharacterized membrane protein